jgi:hypothetical protein
MVCRVNNELHGHLIQTGFLLCFFQQCFKRSVPNVSFNIHTDYSDAIVETARYEELAVAIELPTRPDDHVTELIPILASQVPESNRMIRTCRHHPFAVRTKCDALNNTVMVRELY